MEIQLRHVDYFYGEKTAFERQALKDVSFTIPDKSFTAFIGHTGSGKSTIMKHLNGLLLPTNGEVKIGDFFLTSKTESAELKKIRKKVGLVFQFPEAQLFEETVLKDVSFGPKNYGASEEEAIRQAKEALRLVGMGEEYDQISPFDLSGGQMRRVAIAGILAMEPEVLVLDEPSAGLDPKGRLEMMEMFEFLNQERDVTVVLVTHNMNDVIRYANHVVMMDHGKSIKEGTPREIFSDEAFIEKHQLALPDLIRLAKDYEQLAKTKFDRLPLDDEEWVEAWEKTKKGQEDAR